jgi:hypothetical protein
MPNDRNPIGEAMSDVIVQVRLPTVFVQLVVTACARLWYGRLH